MAEEKGSVEQFGYKQELHRTLSLWDLTVYGLLFMVIIAPHSIFGYVNRDAQGMAPLVYLVGFCAMFFTALSYVQMAKRFPIAGSVYSYVQRGLPRRVAHPARLCFCSQPAVHLCRQLVPEPHPANPGLGLDSHLHRREHGYQHKGH